MKHGISKSAAAFLIFGLGACARNEPPSPEKPASPFRLTATIQDIMDSEIDPAADFLWNAVGSTTTAAGSEDRQPRSEEQWQAVRRSAITLTEAPNLLVMEGREVAAKANKLEDSGTPGIATPDEIRRAIDQNRKTFVELAMGLQKAGLQALAATDAKNVDSLMEAGARIDEACEACHLHYWYPNAPRPPVPPNTP